MKGRTFVAIFVTFIVLFAGGLIYTQVFAYYDIINGQTEIDVQGQPVPVTNFRGIDAETSPLKIRACFELDPDALVRAPADEGATPLSAPGWFDCFDHAALTEDLASGDAMAYVAGNDTPRGASSYQIIRYVAVYPDGRAYLWRQYNKLN